MHEAREQAEELLEVGHRGLVADHLVESKHKQSLCQPAGPVAPAPAASVSVGGALLLVRFLLSLAIVGRGAACRRSLYAKRIAQRSERKSADTALDRADTKSTERGREDVALAALLHD